MCLLVVVLCNQRGQTEDIDHTRSGVQCPHFLSILSYKDAFGWGRNSVIDSNHGISFASCSDGQMKTKFLSCRYEEQNCGKVWGATLCQLHFWLFFCSEATITLPIITLQRYIVLCRCYLYVSWLFKSQRFTFYIFLGYGCGPWSFFYIYSGFEYLWLWIM